MKRYEAEWIAAVDVGSVENHTWVLFLIPAGRHPEKEWYCSCGLSLVNGVVKHKGKADHSRNTGTSV